MQFTIEIPPELEEKLRNAAAKGDRRAISELLLKAVGPSVEELLTRAPKLSEEEFDVLLDQLIDEFEEAIGPETPVLSDEAVSRGGIYGDHP